MDYVACRACKKVLFVNGKPCEEAYLEGGFYCKPCWEEKKEKETKTKDKQEYIDE